MRGARWIGGACLLVGCGTDAQRDWVPPSDDWTPPDAGRQSALALLHSHAFDHTTTWLVGSFYARPRPELVEVIDRVGFCRLREATCDEWTCPIAEPVSVGTLAFEGLDPDKLSEVGVGNTITIPYSPLYTYQFGWGGTFLREPSQVAVSATGATVAGFELVADIPAGLDQVSSEALELAVGRDFAVTWAQPDPDGYVRLELRDCNSQHRLTCDAPDTGAFVVSADILERFLELGSWTPPGDEPCGFREPVFERYRRSERVLFDGNHLTVTVASTIVLDPFLPVGR
jgi:hypothetical protein